jgi:hypothetical protein
VNVDQRDQSYVNIKYEVLDWFMPSCGVISLRPVLMYSAIDIDSSLFLPGSFVGFLGVFGCPRCGYIISIYSRGTVS